MSYTDASERLSYGNSQESVIRHMTDIIVERFNPISIILFGSRARGDADNHSDIDLLVVMPEGTNEKETRIAIRAALCNSPIAKDVLVDTPSRLDRYAKLPGTVQRAALKEGVMLYG